MIRYLGMKLVIQRVTKATVTAQDHYEEIGLGLFILVGVTRGDTQEIAEKLAEKVYKMRIMRDSDDKMNLSTSDAGGEFLVVSQFTLYSDTSGGNRPSFVTAAPGEVAKPIYAAFCDKLTELGGKVKRGSFGNYMKIDAELDGPVTITV